MTFIPEQIPLTADSRKTRQIANKNFRLMGNDISSLESRVRGKALSSSFAVSGTVGTLPKFGPSANALEDSIVTESAGVITVTGNQIISGLTASRLISTNGSKQLSSVSDLTSYIGSTSNRIDVSDDGDGTATIDISSSYIGQTSITTLGTIGTGTWQGTVVDEVYGGTGQSSYTLGDTLYASAANTLSKLSGNTTTTKQFLSQTGDGVNSAAPAWVAITAGDVPTADLAGTSNQVNLSASGTDVLVGSTDITLSLPQDIHTGATPTFAGGTFTGDVQIDTSDGGFFAWEKSNVAIGYIGNAADLMSGGVDTDFVVRATNNLRFTIGADQKGNVTSSAWNFSQVCNFDDTTDASSLGTGSIVTDGGISVDLKMIVGGVATFQGGFISIKDGATQTGYIGDAVNLSFGGASNDDLVIRGVDGVGITTSDGSSDAVYINSSGQVKIGNVTSAPNDILDVGGSNGAVIAGDFGSLIARRTTSNTAASAFQFQKARGSSIVQDGDLLGTILFRGYDGAGYDDSAAIRAEVDGTPALGTDMPGRLVFLTSPDGSATLTEAMRIDSSQNVGIGTASPGAKLHVDQSSATGAIPVLTMDQADVSEPIFEILSTEGAGNAIDETGSEGSKTFVGYAKVKINGSSDRFIKLYNTSV